MAVPVFKRSVSKKQYKYHFKERIQKPIISLTERNLGVSDEIYLKRQKILDKKIDELLRSLFVIFTCISRGEFYPTTIEEKQEKEKYQICAIRECAVLKDNIQFCYEIFEPNNIKEYTQLANDLKDELIYLKYWKKNTEKLEKVELTT